jgi:hypothetical protein
MSEQPQPLPPRDDSDPGTPGSSKRGRKPHSIDTLRSKYEQLTEHRSGDKHFLVCETCPNAREWILVGGLPSKKIKRSIREHFESSRHRQRQNKDSIRSPMIVSTPIRIHESDEDFNNGLTRAILDSVTFSLKPQLHSQTTRHTLRCALALIHASFLLLLLSLTRKGLSLDLIDSPLGQFIKKTWKEDQTKKLAARQPKPDPI